MPFYEYQCASCGHHLEAMQKVSDRPLKKCPNCGKSQLQKLMSAPVFRLKGGGWYETDFKSDQDNKRNLADRPEDAPKENKESSEPAAKEAPAVDAAKADKSPEKPADKPAAVPAAKKAAERTSGVRTAKSSARKRPSRSPVKRSVPKPARRR
jgi:putative FmdB family regulatory protein